MMSGPDKVNGEAALNHVNVFALTRLPDRRELLPGKRVMVSTRIFLSGSLRQLGRPGAEALLLLWRDGDA
jgi:hypothetical protein